MKFQWLIDLWHDVPDLDLLDLLFPCLLFLLLDSLIFCIVHFARRVCIINCCYTSKKGRNITNEFKSQTFLQRLFLTKLLFTANQNIIYGILNWFFNLIIIIAFIVSLIGFVSFLVVPVKGWQLVLMIFPVFYSAIASEIILIIPHLIWDPFTRTALRRQYKFKR